MAKRRINIRLNITLDPRVQQRVDAVAKDQGLSRSGAIRLALFEWLEGNEENIAAPKQEAPMAFNEWVKTEEARGMDSLAALFEFERRYRT